MAILQALSEEEEGCRLTDLSQKTNLSVSTVHRLLTTLERQKFAHFDPSTNLWHVGRMAFTVGSSFLRQRSFVAPALPFLKRLRDLTNETANLGVIEDGEVLVLSQVKSREIMRAITRIGGRVPMGRSGMGKAILSTYPRFAVEAEQAQLHRKPAHMANDGYAVDDEEFMRGLRCIAAAVYGPQGEVLCAISVSGLSIRIPPARVPRLGELLVKTADELTHALGGCRPEG
ncbi:transcriptional regulator [Devosia pacifica]|uniref:Transcriptional regulator n=2 Tax=Devosia pacifica TaxID=1335967 RepID=A0A918S2V4_9HYPH|nr:transcriptional regulator [Devosia pacifica]